MGKRHIILEYCWKAAPSCNRFAVFTAKSHITLKYYWKAAPGCNRFAIMGKRGRGKNLSPTTKKQRYQKKLRSQAQSQKDQASDSEWPTRRHNGEEDKFKQKTSFWEEDTSPRGDQTYGALCWAEERSGDSWNLLMASPWRLLLLRYRTGCWNCS